MDHGRASGVRYLQVGRFFVSAEAGLSRVWRLLWQQQSDFLGSEGKQVGGGDVATGDALGRTLATAKLMLRYLYARFGGSATALTLPLRGDLAIKRLSGAVKLLDLDGRRVYTYMDYDGSREKLAERIASAERVAKWPFAPAVDDADLEVGWLAEEYIAGQHPTGFRGCRECFDQYYLPLLAAFLQAEEPVTVPFDAHVTALEDDILAPAGLLTGVEPSLRAEIEAFVDEAVSRLTRSARFAGGTIALALSHGDFFSGNVILQPDGPPRAIDWATTGTRSPLYDLYYLVMNHCVRVMSPRERRERFEQMLAELRGRLYAKSPSTFSTLDDSLTADPELRWLFYLECVHVPLMHAEGPEDRYIRSLATRIGWFKDFERAMEEDDMSDDPHDASEVSVPTTPAGAREG